MSTKRKNNWLTQLSSWYFSKRVLPYWCLLLMDAVIVFLSCVFVYWVQNRTMATFTHRDGVFLTSLVYALLSWVGARIFRTYTGVVRYSSSVDLLRIANANAVTLILTLAFSSLMRWQGVELLCALTPIATVAAVVVATMLQWLLRIVVKSLYELTNLHPHTTRALIYGALSGGVGLAKYINAQKPVQYELAGFISHEPRIKNMELMGVPVYNLDDDLAEVIRKEKVEAVLVSPLRVEAFRKNQQIQDVIINAGCKIFMVQQAKEASVKDGVLSEDEDMHLTEVSVEDLLPRQQIRVDMKSVGEQLAGKRVLVTGSAGSIGTEIVRQVAQFKPAKMMLIDQAETPQHDIRIMMKRDFPDVPAEAVVTSISRRTRMDAVFAQFRPDYVFHAAAYKHVPMMEDNPSEAVLNNIWGTKVIADLSVKYGVKKFVMVSTDKAVNPTNVMGCSKRICEIYVQSLDQAVKEKKLSSFLQTLGNKMSFITASQMGGPSARTQFVTTRFGNVLGSNGSVIPLFREQIKKGGPVTVTDENIVRFFMLIPEACKLVLEAGTKGNGGEIFVFDMGQPVKIADLAKRMIKLSGAKNVEVKFTGLRPGEKLYEEVLNELEGTKPTFHEKIRIAEVREYDYQKVSKEIDELIAISKRFDDMATVKKMKEIVPEYISNNSVYEQLDKK